MKLLRSGKVRDTYEMSFRDIDDSDDKVLAIVASNRISAFDKVIPGLNIDGKGAILTAMSSKWADLIDYGNVEVFPWALEYADQFAHDYRDSSDIMVETAYLWSQDVLTRVKEEDIVSIMKEYGDQTQFQISLLMIPYECVVRGYITGSLWRDYHEKGVRTFCGVELPEGLQESDKLPEPIFTPTTKAPVGKHDENVSVDDMIKDLTVDDIFSPVCSGNYSGAREVVELLRDVSVFYYKKATEYAEKRGIIIADTKFEFGFSENGYIYLGDEILTPDSSRFWPANDYEPGRPQKSLDTQIVRDYIKKEQEAGVSEVIVPPEIIWQTQDAYQNIYHVLFP